MVKRAGGGVGKFRAVVLWRWLAGLLCLVQPAFTFGATDQVGQSSADRDYVAFEQLLKVRPPASMKEMGVEKYWAWFDQYQKDVTDAGLAFHRQHPSDARRWDAVAAVALRPPLFVKDFGSDAEVSGLGAAVLDEVAKQNWQDEMNKLMQALLP